MKHMVTFETLPANIGRLMEEVDELKEMVLELRKQVSGEKEHVLVGVKEAAEILHKKPVTIYSLCRKGKLPHCKRDEGAKIYFYKDELYDWVDKGRRLDESVSYDEHLAAITATHKRKPQGLLSDL